MVSPNLRSVYSSRKAPEDKSQTFFQSQDIIGSQDQPQIPAAFGETGNPGMAGKGEKPPFPGIERALGSSLFIVFGPRVCGLISGFFQSPSSLGRVTPNSFSLALMTSSRIGKVDFPRRPNCSHLNPSFEQRQVIGLQGFDFFRREIEEF